MSRKSTKKQKSSSMAAKADRHELYEIAVQYAESEIDFVDKTFKKLRGRKAKLLREDFCGTANVCCEWVTRRSKNRAIGVDLDSEVLEWGENNNFTKLTKNQKQRISLLNANVLDVKTEAPDVVLAMNFSYWLFKQRKDLKKYFRKVHQSLADGGILFMDSYGGYESFKELEEERDIDEAGREFTYTWEQETYNPIDGNLLCHIHFSFPDGSSMNKAFTYDWRLWTLPEIRELLAEAGFSKTTVFWQGWDKDGDPDGKFKPAKTADADAGWVSYLTAEK